MKHSDLLFVAKQASAIDTALDAASWVPGFVGAGAGAAKGIKNLAKGHIWSGLGDLAMGGAQLFGGGTLIKGIGKGLQFGGKLLSGTRMGAKAMGAAKGLGQGLMQAAPSFTSGARTAAKAVGNAAYKTMVPEASQFGQKIVGSGLGGMMSRNTGKMTLGGMGASVAGATQEAGQAATQAHDQSIVTGLKGMAQTAQESTPNPLFAQPTQPSWGNGQAAQPPMPQIPGMMGQGM